MIKGSLVVRAQRLSTSAFIEAPFCRLCVIVVSPAIDGSEAFRDNPPGTSKGPRSFKRASRACNFCSFSEEETDLPTTSHHISVERE